MSALQEMLSRDDEYLGLMEDCRSLALECSVPGASNEAHNEYERLCDLREARYMTIKRACEAWESGR